MHERGQVIRCQQPGQCHEAGEVGPVDQLGVGLEGIGAVGGAVEHRARADRLDHLAQFRGAGQIDLQQVAPVQIGQAPGRQPAHHGRDVIAGAQQPVDQVGADEPAAAKHQDRPLERGGKVGGNTGCGRGVVHARASIASRIESASSMLSRRWKACEPYRPDG